MWCLRGIVKALNFPSRLSLRQWCQALARKKDDFINDLINHQTASPHIPLLFILLTHHSSFRFFQSLILRTHTHTHTDICIEAHTPALFQDTATQVALSFLSVPLTLTCSLPDQRAAKVPKKQCHHYSGGNAFSELAPQKDNCLSACPELRKDNRLVQQISSSFLLLSLSVSNMLSTQRPLLGQIKASVLDRTE